MLLSFIILGIFSIVIYNISGVSVIKYINALTRALCDATATMLIWLASIVVTATAGK